MPESIGPAEDAVDITRVLDAHREWVAAGRPGELTQEEASAELLGSAERKSKRAERDVGRIASHPGRLAGQPVFEGTRIRVSTVQAYLRSGRDTGTILEAFPDLQEADVDLARRLL